MVRTQVTLASTRRPPVFEHPELACSAFEFGAIMQQREHVAGQVFRCGHALQNERVNFLVEHRGAGR